MNTREELMKLLVDWYAFVIPLSNAEEVNVVAKKILLKPPAFIFNVDRYTLTDCHVTFRCPSESKASTMEYLRSMKLKYKDPVLWDEHPGTILNAWAGTSMAISAMDKWRNRPDRMQVAETLHFFCDAIGLDYDKEAELYLLAYAGLPKFVK